MEIGVVLVTYNRIDKLKIALKSYEKQTILPKYILVVNNNSTDGTKEYLEEWKKEQNGIEKIIINLEKNTGGSGGFYEGLKNSLNLNAKWVWVADDDAYPKEDAFEVAQKYFEEHKNDNLSAICGTVYTANETIDYSHRRNIYTRFGTIVQKYSNKNIVIVHGKGLGIVKNAVHEALKINKMVVSYKVDNFNDGCTIVLIDLQ